MKTEIQLIMDKQLNTFSLGLIPSLLICIVVRISGNEALLSDVTYSALYWLVTTLFVTVLLFDFGKTLKSKTAVLTASVGWLLMIPFISFLNMTLDLPLSPSNIEKFPITQGTWTWALIPTISVIVIVIVREIIEKRKDIITASKKQLADL